ncbi:MAG: hypothetical protein II826_01315 [Prevotella sp.]|nr:hypothetical protein [Prevotella sp.]
MKRVLPVLAVVLSVVPCALAQGVGPALTPPPLDASHLLLDASLTDAEASVQPFVFNDFREAVAHLPAAATLYVCPGVYWVDDPSHPEVVRGENGREPFGCVVRGKVLRLVGLSADATHTVLASARGQMQGAVGNFTMLDIWCDSLSVENLTLGNYCNVDLDYPLNPALSRRRRSDAITQAHVGYVHGSSLMAKNVRFVSRLNLNPLNGAKDSYYENCHFECTDDALNGTAVYRHCRFDLYGQKPLWSTFGPGAMFVDCDFYVKGSSREVYFCKQGGPVTLVDCRYHAPSDSLYIGWTAYPQRWLRCYQKNFTLNGKPYVIGHRQPENTLVMDSVPMRIDRPPFLHISRHEAEMQVGGGEPLTLTVDGQGRQVAWRADPLLYLDKTAGDTVTVRLACEQVEEPVSVPVTACAVGGDAAVAVCMVTVKPAQLPPPPFLQEPEVRIENGMARLDYQLDLQGRRDQSFIAWHRLDADDCHKEATLAWSNDGPQRTYRLRPADIGRRLMATIRPAHNRSGRGELTEVASRQIEEADVRGRDSLVTDFSDIRCGWSHGLPADAWQADGFKPADTSDYEWSFDPKKPMWEYGEGFNGAVGKGLLQAQRGARLMYTPSPRTYGDMTLTLQADPTKTAGQGFGSATGQYMDVCLKFDTQTLTGYGLRIIRTVKHAKAVDFMLVAYHNGTVTPLTDPVSATCYRTGCTISLALRGGLLTASVETATPKPADSTLPHAVSLSARVGPNPFGGIHIQHTGSCGESTTMLHRLEAHWEL